MADSRTPRNARRRTTSWERRLRDMLIAGGALAIAGCPGSTDDSAFDSTDASVDGPNFCCNANGDPCCTFEHCGAPMNAACACKLDGGTPMGELVMEEGGPATTTVLCIFDAGDVDAGDENDASTDDAGADADTD